MNPIIVSFSPLYHVFPSFISSSVSIFCFSMSLEQQFRAMFEKKQGDTRQMAVYSHLHLFLARPIPLAIGGCEKRDGCHDQKHFMGVKLMAVPVIQAVCSPN